MTAETIPVEHGDELIGFIVLDDETLGPAVGGIRTVPYPNPESALTDCLRLARSMTIKTALAGLATGGGKAVVIDRTWTDELPRQRAFEVLGEAIAKLDGRFRTAGDLGTTVADLAAVASRTNFVHTNDGELSTAVARGLRVCVDAVVARRAGATLSGMKVAVQGCGSIGAAVARSLAGAGASVLVADVDPVRAASVASDIRGAVTSPEAVLTQEVDLVSPCAVGGVISRDNVENLHAWAVVGGANNILADDAAGEALVEAGVMFVPDEIASAGAVIEGAGKTVMGLSDRGPLIDKLGATAATVLDRAKEAGKSPTAVARELANERIAAGR